MPLGGRGRDTPGDRDPPMNPLVGEFLGLGAS